MKRTILRRSAQRGQTSTAGTDRRGSRSVQVCARQVVALEVRVRFPSATLCANVVQKVFHAFLRKDVSAVPSTTG